MVRILLPQGHAMTSAPSSIDSAADQWKMIPLVLLTLAKEADVVAAPLPPPKKPSKNEKLLS